MVCVGGTVQVAFADGREQPQQQQLPNQHNTSAILSSVFQIVVFIICDSVLSCLSNRTWCSETQIINLSDFVVVVADGGRGVRPTRPP